MQFWIILLLANTSWFDCNKLLRQAIAQCHFVDTLDGFIINVLTLVDCSPRSRGRALAEAINHSLLVSRVAGLVTGLVLPGL